MNGIISAARRENCIDTNSISISGGDSTDSAACSASLTLTKYLSGGDTTPTNGETVYNDLCGRNTFNGANDYFSDGTLSFQIDSSGVISNSKLCGA